MMKKVGEVFETETEYKIILENCGYSQSKKIKEKKIKSSAKTKGSFS